jgi:hypothetical protein
MSVSLDYVIAAIGICSLECGSLAIVSHCDWSTHTCPRRLHILPSQIARQLLYNESHSLRHFTHISKLKENHKLTTLYHNCIYPFRRQPQPHTSYHVLSYNRRARHLCHTGLTDTFRFVQARQARTDRLGVLVRLLLSPCHRRCFISHRQLGRCDCFEHWFVSLAPLHCRIIT